VIKASCETDDALTATKIFFAASRLFPPASTVALA
jgi:hypothetical protein